MRGAYLSVWPVLPAGAYAAGPAPTLGFPLEEPACRLYSRARHGLWHGVRALGLGPGDEALVPAYHHGSEVEALDRAGIVSRFYEGTELLEPDEDELESLLSPAVRALYLVHYLGFPQDLVRWRRWCDERGLLLLEDAAQAWLATVDGRPVGSIGDLAIFCLYKTFGLPDGAALISTAPPPELEGEGPVGAGALARKHGRVIAGPLVRLAARARPDRPYDPGEDFGLGDPDCPASRAGLFLLPRAFDPEAAARRRANYSVLREELGDLVPAPFAEPAAGASPFAFPIEVEDKPALHSRLEANGVSPLDFWSVPHPSLPADRFPRAASHRRSVLALPVHQELGLAELERICRAVRPGAQSRRPELRLERLGLADRTDEWDELARLSGNVFATPEWSSLWWRHFGTGEDRLMVAVCRTGERRPVAVLPLYLDRKGALRVVRFLGHGPADQLGPVCAPGDRSLAGRGLRQLLREHARRWDLFLGEQLPADEGWSNLLGASVVRTTGSPVLRFHTDSWDEFLASRSSNFRSQLRRRERRLAADHEVRYRLADDAARLESDLDVLFDLHGRRWSADESPFGGPREPFHREFAATALDRGWLRLWFLEVDGDAVAAWYGFRYAGTESYYQAGRNPDWDDRSVGYLILMHSIRTALEDGMTEYRFLRGDEPYKYRFATHDPRLQIVARGRGVAGRGALRAGLLAYRVPAARRLLRGPLGA